MSNLGGSTTGFGDVSNTGGALSLHGTGGSAVGGGKGGMGDQSSSGGAGSGAQDAGATDAPRVEVSMLVDAASGGARSGTGGAGGGIGTGGAGGGIGTGGTGGACPGPNTCNWCGGSMVTVNGCFSAWRCANGADPCKVSPCTSDSSCPGGQVCKERLCWPDSFGATGGIAGSNRTGGVHGGTAGTIGKGGVGGGGGGTGGLVGSGGLGAGGNASGGAMTCTSNQDCPSSAICCDGSDLRCDGTRLPAGDATNPGEFEVRADGLTVMDTITGLLWQRDGWGARESCADGTSCTWAEAEAYCAGLELGSISGWRLPSLKELRTIMDTTQGVPALDRTAFPSSSWSSFFWTASPYADSSTKAYAVLFGNGGFLQQDLGTSNRVRCVRGSRCYPKDRFVVLDDGLVRDLLTQLVWQRDGSGPRAGCTGPDMLTCTWTEARAYCRDLVAGDLSGFRLPTLKELESLVDFAIPFPGPTIDLIAFPDTPAEGFWTSSVIDNNAWSIYFYSGGSLGHFKTDYYRIRCVR